MVDAVLSIIINIVNTDIHSCMVEGNNTSLVKICNFEKIQNLNYIVWVSQRIYVILILFPLKL